jgi:hypothetical protein
MTKGQEATVYSWEYSKGQEGSNHLETLFLKLINPAQPVQLPDLPLNVVPLIKTATNTSCQLTDDTSLVICRNQVEALPNFAMTDYASQGKTRDVNVVDLGETRTHQGYYTALSRGTTANGTLILSGIHSNKITGGASGALRQEFREQELLDTITTLQYEGHLPAHIAIGNRRNTIISSFRKWKGETFIPSTVHSSIVWSKEDLYLEWDHADIEWAIIKAKNIKVIDQEANSRLKRKAEHPEHIKSPAAKVSKSETRKKSASEGPDIGWTIGRPKRKADHAEHPKSPAQKSIKSGKQVQNKRNTISERPKGNHIGTIWRNNSCAYDAILSIPLQHLASRPCF